MIWGTLLATPFAFTAFLFIPEYWSPPSLFNWAQRYGISIEDVVWSAAVGGIASALSEILFHDRLEQMRRIEEKVRRWKPLILAVIILVVLELLRPAHSIYNMMIAFCAASVYIAIIRRDLIGRMLRGATVFAVVYLLLFAWLLAVYTDFVPRYYNVKSLWGLYVAGIPLEEALFAFTGGAVWTVLYEYTQGYRSARPSGGPA
jgi:hypothetical protein